ncbi:MAG: FtsX-like permease family protein [Propionibacterium sp.]|nr:FtsX-like permease family protein [Propionibacterium sp.]
MRNSITRLVAAGLAIAIGTAFIAATILSTEVVEATARNVAAADLEGADIVVESAGTMLDDRAAEQIAAVPGVDRVHTAHTLPVLLDADGQRRYVEMRNVGPGLELAAGTEPNGAAVVLSTQLADRLGLRLGDTVTLSSPSGDGTAERRVQISGLADMPLRTTLDVIHVPDDLLIAQQRAMEWPTSVGRLLVYTDRAPETLIEPIEQAVPHSDGGILVRTTEEITDQNVRDMVGAANTLMWFGLGFAALAIIVAGLVIANTFEVLVAQRTRTLAMLRCVGASKGQVRSTVLLEAFVLGLVASLVGALLGLGFGQLAVWFLEGRNLGVTVPRIADITPWTLIVPVLVGLAVTLVAAGGPARAATRVSPIAALRPTVVEPVRRSSRARLVVAALLIVGGAGLLIFAVAMSLFFVPDQYEASTMVGVLLAAGILGGLISLIGVMIGAVFVVPPVTRGLGRLLELVVGRRARATVRLATANAVRNPRRTATTTSALVIGVTLVVLMATGAASARASMNELLGQQFPADVVVTGWDGAEIADSTAAEVAEVPGVAAVLPVSNQQAGLTDGSGVEYGGVLAFDITRAEGVVHGAERFADLAPGQVVVPDYQARNWAWTDGDVVYLTDPASGRSTEVTVRVERGAAMIAVLPETLAEVVDPVMTGLLVAVDDGADLDRTVDGISQVVSRIDSEAGYSVSSPAQARQSYEQVIDALLAVVIGLLAVSVVIALVGIANTLSLSVIERRREHAVLRAVGVTKGQLRGALAVEGVLLALTGAVVGIVLGLLYGWSGAAVLLGFTGAFTPGVAPLIMAGSVVIGVVAGLIASVAPANSAIRVPPVVALAAE